MNTPLFRRSISLILMLAMTLSMGLTSRAAENDGLCEHHPSHTTDCGYEANGECTHECTTESGCITVKCSHEHVATCYNGAGKLTCHHKCTSTPACYTPNTDCLHKEHSSCGHSDGKDCDFAVNGCEACENPVIELKGTDVVLTDGTEYTYTGEEITPQVTVMVDRMVLVENEHYTVVYTNNIGVGTGTVTVTGIESAGYKGIVNIPFTIAKAPGTPEFTLVEIKGTDVTIDGTAFPYTGEAIEPAVTVTVGGTQLVAGKDYTVSYASNVEPGTASVTVKGIATASETVGYTGEITIEFTILKAQEPETPSEPEKPTEPETPSEPEKPTEPETPSEPEKPTEPETPSEPEKPTEPETPSEPEKPTEPETPSEPEKPTEPETPSEPEKPTEPETPTEPSRPDEDEDKEDTTPEETFDYKITKGSGSKWHKDSSKNLSFTVNADTDDITAIRIDGKKLDKTHYTLGKNGVVVLKNSWLEKQDIGTYRITIEFEDGDAEGKFTVAAPVDPSNPKTGDNIGLWAGVMAFSLIGTGALLLFGRKYLFK